jgi:hypothetical protein
MQRSPVIFWLLLAATICVDAVAIFWLFEGGFEVAAVTLYIALGIGQLSALCAWVVLFHARLGLRWLVPFIAGFAFALLLSTPSRPFAEALLTFTTLMWVHASLILSLLWFLKLTRIVAGLSDHSTQPSWQFAIRHLLVLMTCVAVLTVVLRRADILVDEPAAVVFFTIGNAILLIAIVAATQTRWPWQLRLTASLGTAIIIAGICEWTQTAFADEINSFAFNLIQAIVIWLWLEQIRPVPATGLPAAAADVPLPG